MSDSKRVTLGDLPSKQRLRRLLFYKFGSIAFEPRFPIAAGIWENRLITPEFEETVRLEGVGIIPEIGRLLDRIDGLDHVPQDEDRFRIYQAYLDYLMVRGRPPILLELRRREWELRILRQLPSRYSGLSAQELSSQLGEMFAGRQPLPRELSGCYPSDPSRRREQARQMGLVLVNGNELPRYRRLFEALGGLRDQPTMEVFVEAAKTDDVIKRHLPLGKRLRDEPFDALVEVMAAPFDLHPFRRWIQAYEMNVKVLPDRLSAVEGTSAADKSKALALYDLFFRLGAEMEILIEGSQPTAGLFPKTEGQQALRDRFLTLAQESSEIPNFFEMWLNGQEALAILTKFGELSDDHLGLLGELVDAFSEVVSDDSLPIMISPIAEVFPPLGFLADAFDPVHHVREPMIFWHALHDPSLHEKGGGSTADFLSFTPSS